MHLRWKTSVPQMYLKEMQEILWHPFSMLVKWFKLVCYLATPSTSKKSLLKTSPNLGLFLSQANILNNIRAVFRGANKRFKKKILEMLREAST